MKDHPIIVHLGCGVNDIRQGWINIDRNVTDGEFADGTRTVCHDLRKGLPLESNSVDVVYSSHFLEHLTTRDCFTLLKECLRVLKASGLFRSALPTHDKLLAAYVNRDEVYLKKAVEASDKNLPPVELRTPIDLVTRELQSGHLALYDVEKIKRLLDCAGFESFSQGGFNPEYDPPGELRRYFSFYVEAHKPGNKT